jgi:hypothetical protein
MSREEQLSQFAAWVQHNITGDEKGQAQIFLDRLFQAFGQPGVLDVDGQIEFRLRKAAEEDGGTAFADLVWKPVVLGQMKKHGTDLLKRGGRGKGGWCHMTFQSLYTFLSGPAFASLTFAMDCTVSAAGEEKAVKPKVRHVGEKDRNGRGRNQT